MHSNNPHHSTPSSTSTPPATSITNANMARAPDGRLHTFPHRHRLDRQAVANAVRDVKKLPLYQEASLEEQRQMCLRAERDEEDKRKRTGRHVSCLFDERGFPLGDADPVVKNAKGGTRYNYRQTGYDIEDEFPKLEKLEEEDDDDDDVNDGMDGDEIDEVFSDEEEEDESESEDEEADDSDQDTGPAVSTGRSYAYPANSVYHIYLPDSRRLDRLDVSASAESTSRSSSLSATKRAGMRVGRALGYMETSTVYHMYLPGGRRLDDLGTAALRKDL